MEIGKINKLKIERDTDHGYFLIDDNNDEVLLPNRYKEESFKIGDSIDVFIYKDSEDRIVATTESPLISINSIEVLKVVDTNRFGAFVDWGLPKDLLIPYKEQSNKLKVNHSYPIYMYLDNDTNRLVGSNKISKFLNNEDLSELEFNQEVEIIIYSHSDLGYKAAINGKYDGLLYKNEVFRSIKIGDKIKAFIKKVREDNKIDLSLKKQGYHSIDPLSRDIMEKLEDEGGVLNISDKSNPEIIKEVFNCSKKQYKKALGLLYKNKYIKIEKNRIIKA